MGILDQILGGLAGGQGGRAGGLGDVLGGALGGAPGGGVPGGTRAGGGQLQRMLVQAAIALVVSHAARGALGGRRGGAAAAPGARMGGAPGAGAPGLDDLLGGLLGGGRPGAGGVAAGMGGAGGLGGLGGLAAILGGAGALGPVLDAFRERGRGDAADSWVGTGANAAVEPRDVEDVFGSDAVESIARQLGIGRDEAAAGLAQVLPEVVDHVTPDGRVPDADRQYASLEDLARRLGPR